MASNLGLGVSIILFSDARSDLRYFETRDSIGLIYSVEHWMCRDNSVLYCYIDKDKCYWKKWCNTHPEIELTSWVTGEDARYVRRKIMEIMYMMRGMDALEAYKGLVSFIIRKREPTLRYIPADP
jgi:hypothetical protein